MPSWRLAGLTASLLALIAPGPGRDLAANGPPLTQCFPTCNTNDARFLIVPGGGGADTFTRNDIVIGLLVPSAAPSFIIGIFDADTGGTWDQGTIPLNYDIYNDANGDAVPDGPPVFSETGSGKPDNAWYDFPAILTSPVAQAGPGADFRYVLIVSNSDTNPFTWSSFKLRANHDLRISPQAFSFLAPLGNDLDAQIVYPNYPNLTPTTYDGTWEFFMELPFPVSQFEIWDGDHDYGASDCSVRDTDDFNTPNSVPPFAAGSSARPEGEATAEENIPDCTPGVKPSGNPPDDDFGPRGALYRRSSHVVYEIVDPSGTKIYRNFNPSGNREWERFVVSVNPADQPDYLAESLPAGVYKVRMTGMDMGNVNAWRFPFDLMAPQRRVRVQKVTGTGVHPQQDFSGTFTPGGPAAAFTVGLPENIAFSSVQSYMLTTGLHTVQENPIPPGWTLIGYTIKPDPDGTASCSPGENFAGTSIDVPEGSENYLVCIRNDFQSQDRLVRIQKVTGTATHPAQTFNGSILPGGPDTTYSLVLGQDQTSSPAVTRTVSSSSHGVFETVPPDWLLIGFTAKPDPNGTASCGVNESYGGGNGTIPAGLERYLICIRNDFQPPPPDRIVRIQKLTTENDHPGGTFTGSVTPGGPATGYSLTLGINQKFSAIQSLTLSSQAHTVTETLPADWTLHGFIVKQDPNGTATCSLNDAFSGTSAQIPSGPGQYLVCIRNKLVCPPDPYKPFVETTVDQQAGTVTVRAYLNKKVVDNTYGANAIGWPSGHTFSSLTRSDMLQMRLFDANGTKRLDFEFDYMSASSAVASGYATLGPDGGDGSMKFGNRSDIVGFKTSLSENFNTIGCVLTVDSPPTDVDYTPHASCPNWFFDVWYEATIRLSMFGGAGYGRTEFPSLHVSPSKNPQPVQCPGNGGEDYCDSHGKPTHITLEYVGGTCASSSTSQPQPNKFNCTDSNGGPQTTSPVFIVAGENDVVQQSVVLGGQVTVPTNGKSNTFVKLYSGSPSQGGVLLETLQIHTSCSAPLIIDDQFGAVVLRALTPQ